MCKILLSITIPTYNRAKFLDRNLQFLLRQKNDFNNEIEIIISDNCSTDNTELVIQNVQSLGLKLRYIKNARNIGPDLNILQCYKEAQGKYMLALGDDDVLLIGSVKAILEIIKKEVGVSTIYLNPTNIDKIKKDTIDNSITYKIYNNKEAYLREVSYFVTFISANVIAKESLVNLDITKWSTSYLGQVPVILNALNIINSKYVFVQSKMLAAQDDNSGGYNFFYVFGSNFNNILKDIFKNERCKKIIIDDVFIRFFPYWVLKLKTDNQRFSKFDKNGLITLLKFNRYFWITSYPILILVNPFDKFFYSTVRILGYIRKKAFTIIINSSKTVFKTIDI